MWNQVKAAIANLVIILVLAGTWILIGIRIKPQHRVLGNALEVVIGVVLLGLLEHGCRAWYRIWRVKA